jgi:hypothetical protein
VFPLFCPNAVYNSKLRIMSADLRVHIFSIVVIFIKRGIGNDGRIQNRW